MMADGVDGVEWEGVEAEVECLVPLVRVAGTGVDVGVDTDVDALLGFRLRAMPMPWIRSVTDSSVDVVSPRWQRH